MTDSRAMVRLDIGTGRNHVKARAKALIWHPYPVGQPSSNNIDHSSYKTRIYKPFLQTIGHVSTIMKKHGRHNSVGDSSRNRYSG